jgi:shikimate dehydrogenase
MQTAALADLGLAPGWSYEAMDIEPSDFERRIRELPGLGFAGVNVTVPHKEAALRLADRSGEAAAAIGAANTLVFEGASIRAENTDAPGLLDAIGESPQASVEVSADALARSRVSDAGALVLGAGGASRAVIWALAGAGAEVSIWNRTADRAEALAAEFGVGVVDSPAGRDFDLIVNASAAGLGGGDGLAELPLEPSDFRPGQTVVDMVYGDSPGTLLEAASAAGARTVDGLEILVRQGARSLAIWTGMEPSLGVMRAAARS